MDASRLTLRCAGCGRAYSGPRLHCDDCSGLLRSEYPVGFAPADRRDIFAFGDWLPSSSALDTPVGPVVYRSERLAAHLGMSDLAIGFNGYAPEIGAENPTGSFKDFEALPTLLYLREHGVMSIVLASAGNTARAFAHAATRLGFRVILVAPDRVLDRLWLPIPPSDDVRLVAIEGSDDYAVAIEAAGLISRILSIEPEGGARNVARRDGMGTAMLAYAREIGELPDHYVQAIGSGTGGIAAWEASQRLINAGVGQALPRLHLAQNAPFTPIHDAWTHAMPIPTDADGEEIVVRQLEQIRRIDAVVLANRTPPYAIPGGVCDALAATSGTTYAATNAEAREAAALFERTEGLPIGPASAVATAALLQGLESGTIGRNDAVLLHITGNNELLVQRDHALRPIEPVARMAPERLDASSVMALRRALVD